jgi:hypothetical protein
MEYGSGIVPVVAALWEWWLLTNSPARHGLMVDVVASVMASVSLG